MMINPLKQIRNDANNAVNAVLEISSSNKREKYANLFFKTIEAIDYSTGKKHITGVILVLKEFNSILKCFSTSKKIHSLVMPAEEKKHSKIEEKDCNKTLMNKILSKGSSICFLISGMKSMSLTLQKWTFIDIAYVANQIGSKVKILSFVKTITISGLKFTGAGMAFILIEKSISLGQLCLDSRKESYSGEKYILPLEWCSLSLALISVAVPIFGLSVSTPVMIGLGILSNGIGLYAIWCKPTSNQTESKQTVSMNTLKDSTQAIGTP